MRNINLDTLMVCKHTKECSRPHTTKYCMGVSIGHMVRPLVRNRDELVRGLLEAVRGNGGVYRECNRSYRRVYLIPLREEDRLKKHKHIII